jgi:dGTPase
MLTRKEWEIGEEKVLAPYAMKAAKSKGRMYKEKEHLYRSAYQRDRDRIIHSTAFRKLEYKTQVFVNHEGDYYRTRLTHTIEVAQIARSIARVLRLNEDLTEAIALAHDIGHTPFGHSGENTLNKLSKKYDKKNGGFEHNRQGLRVVDKLELRYPDFPGLNLSHEVREGISKHNTSYDHPHPDLFDTGTNPTLEAQVVDLADEIAYNNHDLDDGLAAKYITGEELKKNVSIWAEVFAKTKKENPHLDKERLKYRTIRDLINLQVLDLETHTETLLKEKKIKCVEEIKNSKKRLVNFTPLMKEKNKQLKNFLFDNLYRHYKVVRMANKSERFISDMFEVYIENDLNQLPPFYQEKLREDSPYRVVCDYLAGLTDREALDEHQRLFT